MGLLINVGTDHEKVACDLEIVRKFHTPPSSPQVKKMLFASLHKDLGSQNLHFIRSADE